MKGKVKQILKSQLEDVTRREAQDLDGGKCVWTDIKE